MSTPENSEPQPEVYSPIRKGKHLQLMSCDAQGKPLDGDRNGRGNPFRLTFVETRVSS